MAPFSFPFRPSVLGSKLVFPHHPLGMKWFLLALGLAGLALILVFLPSSDPYDQLWRALQDPESHQATLWSLASREDGVGWVARVELGKLLRQKGETEASIALLREALELYETAEARRELAQALEEAGKNSEALAEWTKLLPDPEAAAAVARLSQNKISAGKILVSGRAYSKALEVLAGEKGPEASLWRGRALSGLGRTSEALGEYAKYLAAFPSDAAAQLEYGQLLERTGDTEKALSAYRAAGSAGLYRLGLLLEALGRTDEALSAYRSSSDPEARWRAARILEEKGRISEALAIYRELAEKEARVADDVALRAYLLYLRQGEKELARKMKEKLPPAFLWLLGEKVNPPKFSPDPGPISSEALKVADSLLRRFPREGPFWAQIELGIALRKAGAAEILAIGEWYAKRGEWNRAYALGVRALRESPSRRAYALAYPRAWEESVRKWASEYGVDPLLVWAVMREESGFSPTAISSSGARGLMQLLPSTARWIAEEKLRIPYREEWLNDPDYNIRLGTWYLRYLLDQFGGRVAWAVAAYNGGPGNLRRWAAGVENPAELPARLRSVETREYLVKVLNSWLIYRGLYGS